jgi:di/tricarboxylate transporter
LSLSTDILILLIILLVLVVLFITELFRVDVVAVIGMLSLVWTGILTPSEAFGGFSSNAVLSIISVMILGYGIEQSGIMKKVAHPIVTMAGRSENRLIGLTSLVVGGVSSFLQNIGVAALFLPAVRRICRESKVPASRLLMPMGFAVILGGTLTLVGSGSMIVLNDLLIHAGLRAYGLFGSTPIGITVLLFGILYFLLGGKHLLPYYRPQRSGGRTQRKLIDTLNLNSTVYLMRIPEFSSLVGKTREEAQLWEKYQINLLAIAEDECIVDYAPWRLTRFSAGQEVAVFGGKEDMRRFFDDHNLQVCNDKRKFHYVMNPESAGFAELIVLPGSKMVGKTLRHIAMRKNFDVEPVLLLRGNEQYRGDFSDVPFKPGDIVIIHGLWEKVEFFKDSEDVILASDIEGRTPQKRAGLKIGLIMSGVLVCILAGVNLPVAFFTGVLAMLFFKMVSIDEAYKAVDWRTVFLIAGLIPLGAAMEKTGAALLISNQMEALLKGAPVVVILFAVAVLTTLFTLFMSNVAAVVLLVPLAINIARAAGIDPRPMAMLVAVCTANSFVLPTHQVNAFLMAPGGYRTRDYVKTGGLMTLLFLIVCVAGMYLLYY